MSTETATSLELSRVIEADRETVFRAWTEPERMKRWSCPEGGRVTDVEVDLRVGGRYRIRMDMGEDGVHTAAGVYREIDRPRRLVYTWDWEEEEGRIGETLVTVQFRDRDGSTEVVLRHELFPGAEARDAHRQGWASCLNQLEGLLG